MVDRHRQAEIEADRQRQMRAAERDIEEQRLEAAIRKVEQLYRSLEAERRRDRGFDIGR